MALSDDAAALANDTHAQIRRLREQVEALMRDRVSPAISDLTSRAESAAQCAGGAVRHQAGALSSRVKEQPLISVMVAVALGWVIGRAMR
jgi:ElaB/YqjD/DUF883 family membrane-anchored ribosome-binding protein